MLSELLLFVFQAKFSRTALEFIFCTEANSADEELLIGIPCCDRISDISNNIVHGAEPSLTVGVTLWRPISWRARKTHVTRDVGAQACVKTLTMILYARSFFEHSLLKVHC